MAKLPYEAPETEEEFFDDAVFASNDNAFLNPWS
jgi:hypothetical protein